MGLINRVVPAGTALDAAKELAAKIVANGPLAVAASKQVVLAAVRLVGRKTCSRSRTRS